MHFQPFKLFNTKGPVVQRKKHIKKLFLLELLFFIIFLFFILTVNMTLLLYYGMLVIERCHHTYKFVGDPFYVTRFLSDANAKIS